MAMPGYDLPPEIDAEQQRIAKQQAIAEAMLQRGMTPLPTNQGPLHWTQGIAQILNAYSGRKGMDAAAKDRAGLGAKYQQGLADEVKRIAAMRQGTPTTENIVDEQANGGEGAPAQIVTPGRPDPRGAIQAALLSQYAPVRQMGALEHRTFENEQTRENDRAARMQERILTLEAAAQNQALAREERAARAAEAAALRRELAEMADATRRAIAESSDATRRELAAGRRAEAGKAPAGFRWTQNGDLERIPGGPADLKSQADQERKASGAGDIDISISTLRDAYDRLEKGGGITSTQKGAFSNATAAASSSAPGQLVGRIFGTQNQSARNDIAMARPGLLAAIMKATGMSARQMDSNAELKLWIATATDPTLDVEANRRALASIEKKYLKGQPASGAGGGPAGGSAPRIVDW